MTNEPRVTREMVELDQEIAAGQTGPVQSSGDSPDAPGTAGVTRSTVEIEKKDGWDTWTVGKMKIRAG